LKKKYKTKILGEGKRDSFLSNLPDYNQTVPASPSKHIASPSTMKCFNLFKFKADDVTFTTLAGSKLEGTPTTKGDTLANNSYEEEEIAPFEPVASPMKKNSI
jgi:hypothetical protein